MTNEKKILLFPVASHFLFHFYEIAFPALAIPLTLSLGMSLKEVLALGFPMYSHVRPVRPALGNLRRSHEQPPCPRDRLLRLRRRVLPHGSFLDTRRDPVVACRRRDFLLHLPPGGHGPHLPHGEKPGGRSGTFSVAGTIGLIVGPFLAGMLNWLAGWKVAYTVMGIVSLLWGAGPDLHKNRRDAPCARTCG